MARPDAFATIRRARTLKERHPDAPTSVAHVALVMATYADGKTGTMIRPGLERVAEETGLHRDTVRDAVRWLEERGELRRDRQGHRGSAACFTYLNVCVEEEPPSAPPARKAQPKCSRCGSELGYEVADPDDDHEGILCYSCWRA